MRLSKAGYVLLGAVVATALTLTGTGIAAATSHGSPQPPGPVVHTPKKVTSASLCRALFAAVNADGTLARAGCPGTTSTALGTGTFEVDFPRAVEASASMKTKCGDRSSATSDPRVNRDAAASSARSSAAAVGSEASGNASDA